MDFTVPLRFSGYAGMDIGRDNGGVVDRNYANRAPFAFTGTIKKVTFDIKPHLTSEDEQSLHESAHHGHVAHGISGFLAIDPVAASRPIGSRRRPWQVRTA